MRANSWFRPINAFHKVLRYERVLENIVQVEFAVFVVFFVVTMVVVFVVVVIVVDDVTMIEDLHAFRDYLKDLFLPQSNRLLHDSPPEARIDEEQPRQRESVVRNHFVLRPHRLPVEDLGLLQTRVDELVDVQFSVDEPLLLEERQLRRRRALDARLPHEVVEVVLRRVRVDGQFEMRVSLVLVMIAVERLFGDLLAQSLDLLPQFGDFSAMKLLALREQMAQVIRLLLQLLRFLLLQQRFVDGGFPF